MLRFMIKNLFISMININDSSFSSENTSETIGSNPNKNHYNACRGIRCFMTYSLCGFDFKIRYQY